MSNLEKALQAAMEGPEVKDLHVFGHDWNVKPAKVQKDGNTITVSGQISHNVRWSPDDQVYYEFIFDSGKMTKHNIRFEEKGWGAIAGKIVNAVLPDAVNNFIPPDKVEEFGNKLENMAHGNWQEAVQKLALRIGLEGYRRSAGTVRDHRATTEVHAHRGTAGVRDHRTE